MATIHFISIEIGHESPVADTPTDGKSDMQKCIEGHLKGNRAPADWTAVRDITINDNTSNDLWVAAYLQTEINNALQTGSVNISEAHIRFLRNDSDPSFIMVKDGSPGTRCKLLGEKWVNARSYKLHYPDGKAWPSNRVPLEAMVFATLSWRCYPK